MKTQKEKSSVQIDKNLSIREEIDVLVQNAEEALKAYPEYYKEFIEYNPELITNDVDVMELIHQYGNHS